MCNVAVQKLDLVSVPGMGKTPYVENPMGVTVGYLCPPETTISKR